MFTKLLKPVVALLCRLGLRLIVYLDDIILFTQTPNRILQDRDTTLWLLQQLGFVINWKKSVLIPAQSMEYLGFVINYLELTLALPGGKNAKTDSVLQAAPSEQGFFCQRDSQSGGKTDLINAGNSPSTATLQTLTNVTDKESGR
jgi:hypothetical protein